MYEMIQQKAQQMRLGVLLATEAAGSGHPTSCFSAADIVAALFFHAMRYDPDDSKNLYNDRFILSKGHAAPLLYAAWWQAGVLSFEQLLTLRKFGSMLEGHPTPRFAYVDVATGSLGCGLSIGVGSALALDHAKRTVYTYVLLGDGECAEGSVWEAAEVAAFYKTKHLIGVVDCNGLGQTAQTIDGHQAQNLAKKFEAFGWRTYQIDGHDMSEIVKTLDEARCYTDGPVMIIARTIKGYGLQDVADQNGYHGKVIDKIIGDAYLAQYRLEKTPIVWHKKMPEQVAHYKKITFFDIPNPSYFEAYATRKAYGDALLALGKLIPEIIVLDAEVSNSTYACIFAQKFQHRFLNCFIAEQNMIGMAQGFYIQGYIPFISTFGAFFSRAYDQLRMAAIAKHSLRLIGSHAGVSIGQDGPSQMALEDIALMRALPDSVVLYPCDGVSAYRCVELAAQYNHGISYVRMTREATLLVYKNNEEFYIGGSHLVRKNRKAKALIVAAGITVHEAIKAEEMLEKELLFISVMDAYSIKPLDIHTLLKEAQLCNNTIVVVEDHYLQGGLSDAVRTAVAQYGFYKVITLAVSGVPRSGTPEELRAWAGIDAQAIYSTVKTL